VVVKDIESADDPGAATLLVQRPGQNSQQLGELERLDE
jgi:hypothetical protein